MRVETTVVAALGPRREGSGGAERRRAPEGLDSEGPSRGPEVTLFDEPTSNLDLKYQLEGLSLVRSLSRRGLIVIMALHDLTQAYRASDKVLLLNSGKVVAAGSQRKSSSRSCCRRSTGSR